MKQTFKWMSLLALAVLGIYTFVKGNPMGVLFVAPICMALDNNNTSKEGQE